MRPTIVPLRPEGGNWLAQHSGQPCGNRLGWTRTVFGQPAINEQCRAAARPRAARKCQRTCCGPAASALALPRGARSGCRSALLVNGRLAEHGSGPAEAVATRLTRMLSEPIATLGSEWHDCRPHLSRKRTPAPRPREPHAGERWALGGSVGKQRQLRSDQTTYGSASSDPCAPAAAIPEP